MSIVIFAGPTISQDAVRDVIDADILPPVSMGDVYRVSRQQPRAIGIIDGYFDGVPSVWHKEILWALDRSIPVFGAASMGALRAAELYPFGMIGAGRIFEAFRDGEIEDDDEVAVHHGPQEVGYVALSEAMVNIRATLERAVGTAIIDQAVADTLIQNAKDTGYPDRNWENLLRQAGTQLSGAPQLAALRDWLPDGRVDQKKLDAVAMLTAVRDHLADNRDWAPPAFDFEWTVMWDQLVKQSAGAPQSLRNRLILDLVRRDPETYQDIRLRAAARVLATTPARPGKTVDPGELKRELTRFRAENGLYSKRALDGWLAENDLDEAGFQALMADKVRLQADITSSIDAVFERMLEDIDGDDRLAGIAEEAEQLEEILKGFGSDTPEPHDVGVTGAQLVLWYFEKLLEIPVPDDLGAFIRKNDFANRAEFDQMMVRQHIWSRHMLEQSR